MQSMIYRKFHNPKGMATGAVKYLLVRSFLKNGGDNDNYNDSENVIKTRLLVMIQITMIIQRKFHNSKGMAKGAANVRAARKVLLIRSFKQC